MAAFLAVLLSQESSVPSELPNVLASRYASDPMVEIWSPAGKVILEREFWIAVLEAQRDLGIDVPDEVVQAYRQVRPGYS